MTLTTPAHISDLIGNAHYSGETTLTRDKADFDPAFWDLRSGLLGELTQKLVNYQLTLKLTGDFSQERANSRAFNDFCVEMARGGAITFRDEASA